MVMPDANNAIISLMNHPIDNIKSHVYHISTFNPTPEEFYKQLIKYFPDFKMTYKINPKRQAMVNSWPLDLNCNQAINEWNWQAEYHMGTAFSDYLIPQIKIQYNIKGP